MKKKNNNNRTQIYVQQFQNGHKFIVVNFNSSDKKLNKEELN